MDNDTLVQIIGWTGVIFYVLAYLLLATGIFKSNGYNFHLFNILGATGLIIDSAHQGDHPNLTVNLIWLIIGIFAIARRYFTQSGR